MTYSGASTINLLAGNITLNNPTGTANGTVAVTGGTMATPTVTISGMHGQRNPKHQHSRRYGERCAWGKHCPAAGPSTPFTVGLILDRRVIGAPSVTTTSSGPVTYTVTYTGATTVTLGTGDITLNTTGTATGTLAVTGSGTATRTVTISGITGNGRLGISIDPGTASDTAGNASSAAGPSTTFIVDNTVLTLVGTSLLATEAGPTTGTITVTLNNPGAVAKTINLTLSGTAATEPGTDYNLTGTGVTWAGGTVLTINFPIGATTNL